ncbi:MAG: P-II family nitrogen regulator [Elusimicrobia bacterium]|nr:P-II family nitrogen regulator [Elusimicrobiota bacterium]
MAKKEAGMNLITAVVRHTLAEQTLKAALQAGAPGITYFWARGTGVKENLGYAGTLIEPEKQVLWVVTKKAETQKVLDAIIMAANLSLPGEGFAYVQPVTQAIGFIER